MRTYEEIKAAVIAKGYQWFDGELNLNMVFERTSYEATDLFDDFWYCCFTEQGIDKVIALPATTKPGNHLSLDRPYQPSVDGIVGTAIIIPGQYHSAWQFHDTTAEFLQYPYFRQVGPIMYWRDGNRDSHIDQINEQDNKIYGTHWHRMSNFNEKRTPDQLQVHNWAEGCMGTPISELDKLLPLVRQSVNIYGTNFTGTILESKDFN